MLIETLLASAHLWAMLGMVVFSTTQAVICRPESMNAALVQRLLRLDRIYLASVALLLGSGAARLVWGIKGWQWYVGQPLFHIKMTLVALTLVLVVLCSLTIRRWVRQAPDKLPSEKATLELRRRIMWHTHVMPLIVLAAAFWARGW